MFKLRPSTTQSSLSSIQSNENLDELTIESMSAVIAAAVQISSQGGQPSSLSLGSASILQPFSQKNQRSSFWPTRKSKPANIKDDGRDELVYRGIQIKEVKTTLKTLVIPDQISHPMPEVKLERPSFARVSY